ncbi:MAG: hypothetical protein ACF8GE_09945 [Phycisphaerales bacterium JB043]
MVRQRATLPIRLVLALAFVSAMLIAPPLLGQANPWGDIAPESPVIVTLRTGERYHGAFVGSTETYITVRIGNVETRVNHSDIRSLVTERPPIERYAEMRALIDDEDVERLLILVDWLRTQELYEIAIQELEHVLEVEPGNGDAIRLLELTRQQKSLADSKQSVDDGARPSSSRSRDVAPANRPESWLFPVLSEENANLIQVYEIDLDNPPKLLIERETIDALIESHAGIAGIPANDALADDFFKKSPSDILAIMFEARARELYNQVRVLDLPESLRNFRDNVNSTWLVNTCATTTCHGGLDSGDFLLFNRAANNKRSAITNFLILERFRTSEGESLLNYEFPENSLLLHYAMPLNRSARPHPQVRGFRPAFRSTKSRRYAQALDWLYSMHKPRPEYPIEFTPPKPSDFERDESVGTQGTSEPADR